MPIESMTRSGRILRVIPDIEWYQAGDQLRGYRVAPAFRDDIGMAKGDPSDNYGQCHAGFEWYMKGALGCVQFKMFTGWSIAHTEDRIHTDRSSYPMAADLGYHSLVGRDYQEGEPPSYESCELLDGAPCWYDGSGLNAKPVMKRLIREGMPGVWRSLTNFYNVVCNEGEWLNDDE